MPHSILTTIAFLSQTASASPVTVHFTKNSALPEALQSRISERLATGCPTVTEIYEQETSVREEEIDQGKRITFYTSVLSGRYTRDGAHPIGVRIWIESEDSEITNPAIERYTVNSLSSDAGAVCR